MPIPLDLSPLAVLNAKHQRAITRAMNVKTQSDYDKAILHAQMLREVIRGKEQRARERAMQYNLSFSEALDQIEEMDAAEVRQMQTDQDEG